jgi:D-glutamate cyclase
MRCAFDPSDHQPGGWHILADHFPLTHAAGIPWSAIHGLVRRDPGRRGIAGFVHAGVPLCATHLETAAGHLAQHAKAVALVTGFPIVDAPSPAAETDGPPGALYLARALLALGVDVALISDSYALPLLEVGCDLWRLPRSTIRVFPFEEGDSTSVPRVSYAPQYNRSSDGWIDAFLASPFGQRLTHVIAIERPGPSHTAGSLARQPRAGAVPLDLFEREVPPEDRDVCHNIRGEQINGYTAKTHRLFEVIAERGLAITTIGMADGGNELGMGSVAWEVLREAIAAGSGGRVACRIAADYTILAGVSNWAAYAVATTLCLLADRPELPRPWGIESQRELIESLVRSAGAVDGVTRRREPTVDGLPLETYLQILAGIRRLCGVEDG